jgi:hypothetical protein
MTVTRRGFFKDWFRIEHEGNWVSVYNDATGDLVFTETFPETPRDPIVGYTPALRCFNTLVRAPRSAFAAILTRHGYPANRI